MTDLGSWCWFSDPRAIYSAAHNRTYVGWVSPSGSVMAKQIDHATGTEKVVTVHANLQQDDHCNPGFLEMPDGRVYIFYAAAPLYMRDDGLYFAGDGANRKQIATAQ